MGAVVREYGADLSALRAADVHVAPAGGVRVRYTGDVHRADGSRRTEVLVAATGDHIPQGAAVVSGEYRDVPTEVGVWRWPQDPSLPGLSSACDPRWLATTLAGIGVTVTTMPRVAVRSYRPGQRAVLEITASAEDRLMRWFVKVVRPESVSGLQLRHELLGRALPVPPVLFATPDGVVLLPEAPGISLRQLISAGDSMPPTPEDLQALLDLLPDALMALPARPTHLQRFEQSVRVLELTTGSHYTDIADVLRSAPTYLTPSPVPVHGDFHIGQLLVTDGAVSGVIDVDTAGRGDRVDEWATMLAHLSVVGLTSPRAHRLTDVVLHHAVRHVDPTALGLHTAAAVLGLATGPFRTQRPDWRQWTDARIDVAQQWIWRMRDHSSSAPASLMSTRDR